MPKHVVFSLFSISLLGGETQRRLVGGGSGWLFHFVNLQEESERVHVGREGCPLELSLGV